MTPQVLAALGSVLQRSSDPEWALRAVDLVGAVQVLGRLPATSGGTQRVARELVGGALRQALPSLRPSQLALVMHSVAALPLPPAVREEVVGPGWLAAAEGALCTALANDPRALSLRDVMCLVQVRRCVLCVGGGGGGGRCLGFSWPVVAP